ncbi:MAG TPA: homoserine kinase [Pyrinomonadaceae bacterium]|nr:homoserine kinase [Pyrinomonadaceae bacterium]
MKVESVIAVESEKRRAPSFTVRVPASTSNLGAGFDCFGLALRLYLTVRATVVDAADEPCRVRNSGEGVGLSRAADNLIYVAMRHAATREGLELPPVRLAVRNELPLGRGLGSSAAAVVAGLSLCSLICGRELSDETILRYALELEGHPDNVAPALYGGFVVNCVTRDGGVLAVKRRWPADLKVIVVSPDVPLKTAEARDALPGTVGRAAAVHNIQRAALFVAALDAGRYDLLWEAMRDCLHQEHRETLVPGLSAALSTPREPGLVGLALSGAGPSVVALATSRFAELGEKIAESFRRHGTGARVRVLDVDDEGLQMKRMK